MSYCFQTTTSSGLSFFIFRKLIQVVFPSLGWSSCFPLSSCRDDEFWVPLSNSSGPSFLALCGNSQGLTPLQFLLCLDPICDVVCQHFLISFSCAFFLCTLSNLLTPLPGLRCFLSHFRKKCCSPGHVHRLRCLLSQFIGGFTHFAILNVFSSQLFFFVFYFPMSSLLRSMHVPAIHIVVGVTTASKRCILCRSR